MLRTIKNVDLRAKRVFLRTGWDAPLTQLPTINNQQSIKSGQLAVDSWKSEAVIAEVVVADDLRIRESLPTIRYLIEHGVVGITIATHLGRPEGRVVAGLSVRPVVEKLVELLSEDSSSQSFKSQAPNSKQIPITLPRRQAGKFQTPNSMDIGYLAFNGVLILEIGDLTIGNITSYKVRGTSVPITVLENLRFDPQEEANDEVFAKELAAGHDLYINDAFSNCHREHASMVAITKFLPAYAGLLVEDEIKHLSLLQHNPSRPFVVVIGGAKIEDKMGVIEYFAKHADAVLLGGKTGLEYAHQKLPAPNPKCQTNSQLQIPNAKLLTSNTLASHIYPPIDDIEGYDIGPKTIALFIDKVKTAWTIFWNGNMGMSEDKRYATGTLKLTRAIADSAAKIKIVGGGDTTAFVHQHLLADKMTYLSSGGGATLDYLAGQEMPGLEPLLCSGNSNN